LNTDLVYPNGLSTAFPDDIQLKLLQTIGGLEAVEMTQAGYAVEYDFIDPQQLYPTLQVYIHRYILTYIHTYIHMIKYIHLTLWLRASSVKQ